MTLPLDEASAAAVARTLGSLRQALVDADPRREWLDLADKAMRHELRLRLTEAAIEHKQELRASGRADYTELALALDGLVGRAVGFRTLLDAHQALERRLRAAVRIAGVVAVCLFGWGLVSQEPTGAGWWTGTVAVSVLWSVGAWLPNAPAAWWTRVHLELVRVRTSWLLREFQALEARSPAPPSTP